MDCWRLIPSFDPKFRGEEGDCLLSEGHGGWHLTPLNNGSYLSWGDDSIR